MADEILDKIRDAAEGQIDFKGQALAEFLATALLVIVGATAFIAGYRAQDIKGALFIGLAGTAVTFLIVVPPWPFYNRHPVKWLKVRSAKPAVIEDIIIDGELVAGLNG